MSASVHRIGPAEAGRFLNGVGLGARTLLDVRQDFEYAEGHLPGATHIPLPELDQRLGELDRSLPVLVYCRSGARSLAGANLLAGQGFREVLSLDGGIMAWQGAQAQGPADLGLDALLSAASPAELLERAWGMELALQDFYAELAARTEDAELKALYERFAGFEERHRRAIAEAWSRLPGSDASEEGRAAFEAGAALATRPGMLEGGLGAGDYLGMLAEPSDQAEAFELAMAIEAQALDLYLRRGAGLADAELRKTLLLLAGEERAHLKVLGAFASGRGRL